MNRDDMRMVQAGEDTGFTQVVFDFSGSRHAMAVRHLDGHNSPKFIVVAFVNNAETTGTKFGRYPVAAKENRLLDSSRPLCLRPGTCPLLRRSAFLRSVS